MPHLVTKIQLPSDDRQQVKTNSRYSYWYCEVILATTNLVLLSAFRSRSNSLLPIKKVNYYPCQISNLVIFILAVQLNIQMHY